MNRPAIVATAVRSHRCDMGHAHGTGTYLIRVTRYVMVIDTSNVVYIEYCTDYCIREMDTVHCVSGYCALCL